MPAGLKHQVEFMPVESIGHGKGGILGGDLLVVPLTSDGVVEHRHTSGTLKVGFDLDTDVQMGHAPFGFHGADANPTARAEQTIHHVRGRS